MYFSWMIRLRPGMVGSDSSFDFLKWPRLGLVQNNRALSRRRFFNHPGPAMGHLFTNIKSPNCRYVLDYASTSGTIWVRYVRTKRGTPA